MAFASRTPGFARGCRGQIGGRHGPGPDRYLGPASDQARSPASRPAASGARFETCSTSPRKAGHATGPCCARRRLFGAHLVPGWASQGLACVQNRSKSSGVVGGWADPLDSPTSAPYRARPGRLQHGRTSGRGATHYHDRHPAPTRAPAAATRCRRRGRRGRDAPHHLRIGRRAARAGAGRTARAGHARLRDVRRVGPDGGNAILACHALSGDAHAAGWSADLDAPSAVDGMGADEKGIVPRGGLGWWDGMIGPGKAFDTAQVLRDLLERDRKLPGLDRAGLDRPADRPAVRLALPAGDRRRHGAGAARAAASPRGRAAAGGGGRIAGRQPGVAVDAWPIPKWCRAASRSRPAPA